MNVKHTNESFGFFLYLTLMLLVCNSTLSSDLYLPSLPSVMVFFNTTSSLTQLTLVSYMLGFACSVLLSGVLSDYFSKKNIIVFGLMLQFLATIGCLFSHTIEVLIFFRFIQALGGCCGTVLSRTIVNQYVQSQEAVRILSILSTGLAVALAVAPVLGGIIQKYLSWQGCFYFIIALNLIMLFLSIVFIPSERITAVSAKTKIFPQFIKILSNKVFLYYSIIIGCSLGGYFSFISGSAFVFMNKYHLSAFAFGCLYAGVIISYIIGSMLARKYAYKALPEKMIATAVKIAMVSTVLMLTFLFVSTNVILYLISFVVFNLAVGIIMPNCQVGALQNIKERVGAAAGLFYFLELGIAAIFGYILSCFENLMFGTCVLSIIASLVMFFSSIRIIKNKKNIGMLQAN